MIVLLFFAFISGLVTILAPCIWPILPIILSSSATGGKRKPLGITLGIMTSFTLFTLFLSYVLKFLPIDPDSIRLVAVFVIGFFGLSLIVPSIGKIVEGYVSGLSGKFGGGRNREGFEGGFITGLSLGIVWSPCAGPILATIATLAATQSVNISVVFVTLVYVAGVGIPLFLFAFAGQRLLQKSRFVSAYTGRIQQIFGVIMILTALGIFTHYDQVVQTKLLDLFPSYSNLLYKLESNSSVTSELQKLKKDKTNIPLQTKPGILQNMVLPNLGKAPEFIGITNWINSSPLTMEQLKGKVVLVDFWTYTCINCIRTLPHIVSWYEKYKDKGFVVVGVHTPEFEFEKKTANVQEAINRHKITYPVAQDNDFATWNAYHNNYWPAKYLVDAQGNVRKTHFGEGEYEEMEMAIQDLLKEKGEKADMKLSQLPDESPTVRLTPESYLGLDRMDRFASNESIQIGTHEYTAPSVLGDHQLALGKQWNVQHEYSVSGRDAFLEIRFSSQKVFLVMSPSQKESSIKVFLDDKPISSGVSGSDVKNGVVTLDTERLYELVDLKKGKETHLLRIEFQDKGIKIYAFTFG